MRGREAPRIMRLDDRCFSLAVLHGAHGRALLLFYLYIRFPVITYHSFILIFILIYGLGMALYILV